MKSWSFLIPLLSLLLFSNTVLAQKGDEVQSVFYEDLNYRCIGPFRGGRSAAVTGVSSNPLLHYFGSTGGGVWKTIDGGQSWKNISDGFFGGSIGAIAVASSDQNVIYVGGGEKTVRGNVSYGYGMFRSVDAGKTWNSIGLENSKHISRIRVHPDNPDIVYVAVMGDLYKPTKERGVYKSINGGQNWKKILFANESSGVVDLVLDPSNHRILYASTWRIQRTPFSLSSGGDGSALWKSTDEGKTWKKISDNKGFPNGTLGIIGVAVSPVNSEKVYVIAESEKGGVFVSEDGGDNWTKTNSDRSLRQRAWYYSRIYADTKDENTVYVLNVRYHKSVDGGKTFKSAGAPHGDHHDLWIDPSDPKRMIIGDDGGAQISFDGGENWSSYMNQPTSQFYRVVTDNHFPFRIYGAQQDNSTVRISHRTDGYSIGESDWEKTAGGESAHIAIDPDDNEIVYGGSYGGFLVRKDHRTKQSRAINVWPDNPMGHGAEGMKYRFQWNFPVFFSPHNPKKLYVASNHLHVSTNEGQSWEIISPDLTRNDPEKLKSSGGPITQDNTGVEYYCTIFAACESPYEEGLIWVGSDDGLLHLSLDGGGTWNNITPKGFPEFLMVNSIEPDPFNPGGAFVAGTSYKMGDYSPYLFRTKDYGKSWKKITDGIPDDHFTRVVRADQAREGLLYAGTETGMYVSFNNGESWQSFQLNLPMVPITDLTIKENKLIVATQGRSFWILDDLTVLHQIGPDLDRNELFLFEPENAWRFGPILDDRKVSNAGQNHPGGVQVFYWMPSERADSLPVCLSFADENGNEIKKYCSDSEDKKLKLKVEPGLNRFTWNMRYSDAEGFDGLIMWGGSLEGPVAIPGDYQVKLKYQETCLESSFSIMADPRSSSTQHDLAAQFDFLISARDTLSKIHIAIKEIRFARKSINDWSDKLDQASLPEGIEELSEEITAEMKMIEESLYQTKNQSGQDPLNFPIRLNNKLAHLSSLVSMGNNKPTNQSYELRMEIQPEITTLLSQWERLKSDKIQTLNNKLTTSGMPLISVK